MKIVFNFFFVKKSAFSTTIFIKKTYAKLLYIKQTFFDTKQAFINLAQLIKDLLV